MSLSWIYSRNAKIKKSLTVCPHGIQGGDGKDSCPECIREKEEKSKIEQEQKRQYELQKSAKGLWQQEISHLRFKQHRKLEYLHSLSSREFLDAVTSLYRMLGYQVIQVPHYNDYGKIGKAFLDGEKYIIECKKFVDNNKIGKFPLQKFFKAMCDEKAAGGLFVTTGVFARAAIEYAKDKNIELIDGMKLISLMREAYPESHNDTVKVMCLQCGEVVEFNLAVPNKAKCCRSGHLVENNITYEELNACAKHGSQ